MSRPEAEIILPIENNYSDFFTGPIKEIEDLPKFEELFQDEANFHQLVILEKILNHLS